MSHPFLRKPILCLSNPFLRKLIICLSHPFLGKPIICLSHPFLTKPITCLSHPSLRKPILCLSHPFPDCWRRCSTIWWRRPRWTAVWLSPSASRWRDPSGTAACPLAQGDYTQNVHITTIIIIIIINAFVMRQIPLWLYMCVCKCFQQNMS